MVTVDGVHRVEDRITQLEELTSKLPGGKPRELPESSDEPEETLSSTSYVPPGATATAGVLPVLPCGTDPLDAIQELFDRMLHIDRCLDHVHQYPVLDSDLNRPIEFRTKAEIKDAYMYLFLDSLALDFKIKAYVTAHGAAGTGLLHKDDAEMVDEENRGFKHEMGTLSGKVLMMGN